MACVLQSSCHSEGLQIPAQVFQSSTRSPTSRAQSKTHSLEELTSSRAARPGTGVTLTDAYLRLYTNGVVARELCPISAEQFLFVMGAAIAHLDNPRQWSRAPCNLKGSGAESGSRAYCGLNPLAGFDTCNLCLFFKFLDWWLIWSCQGDVCCSQRSWWAFLTPCVQVSM